MRKTLLLTFAFIMLTSMQTMAQELLWSQYGCAWKGQDYLCDVVVKAYDDNSYEVTNWQGTEGYSLMFTIDENGAMNITNAYAVNYGYSYVLGGGDETAPIYYTGLYTGSGYSKVFASDLETVTDVMTEDGGYFWVYAYAYDYNDALVYGGYYTVQWGAQFAPEEENVASVKAASKSHLYYDLSGRTYTQPVQKGLYIHGGKKLIIK